ncbi:DUF3100 domain-containing protein [Thalassospira australica]|uniref:DUF3100 domain-containing protein n=1 Tax=Thalassospira australica TaxID=1528106 RepID=UPI00384AEEFE
MNALRGQLELWRLHLAVIVLGAIAELIGIQKIPLGIGAILLLPLLYAFVMAALMNPNVMPKFAKFIRQKEVAAASPLIVIAIMPFIAKFGTTIGPAIETIIAAGPALLLQELGNLGTIVLAFPLAVWGLKMGREAIGATFSIAREPNLAIIADRYTLKSPEGTGVMGVYVIGTLFGTFIFAILASLFASADIFDPRALAMACGIGSGSMMAACTGALTEVIPSMKDEILALAGASNLLTYATGLYAGLFIALPIVEKLYNATAGKNDIATANKKEA